MSSSLINSWSNIWGLGGYSYSWFSWASIVVLLYIPLCITIRSRQVQKMIGRQESREIGNMTLEEAYSIKTRLAEQEFPLVFSAAMASVFFKAEGIPSIAALVARAARRSASSTSAAKNRHHKQTAHVSPSALLSHPLSAQRAEAINHVNRIHDLYRPSGKMSDEDLLYVLSLWPLEVIRGIERFDYRPLTLRETAALAILWMEAGKELRIPYGRLPSYTDDGPESTVSGKREHVSQGRDGIEKKDEGESVGEALNWLSELEAWSLAYEKRCREKSADAVFLGRLNMDKWAASSLGLGLGLGLPLPRFLRPVARHALAVFIEPELRSAMGIDDPPIALVAIVRIAIAARKLVRGYLCSPVALLKGNMSA